MNIKKSKNKKIKEVKYHNDNSSSQQRALNEKCTMSEKIKIKANDIRIEMATTLWHYTTYTGTVRICNMNAICSMGDQYYGCDRQILPFFSLSLSLVFSFHYYSGNFVRWRRVSISTHIYMWLSRFGQIYRAGWVSWAAQLIESSRTHTHTAHVADMMMRVSVESRQPHVAMTMIERYKVRVRNTDNSNQKHE